MGQNNRKLGRIKDAIFENPEQTFTIREYARMTKIPKSTIQRYLLSLQKMHMIDKNNRFIISNYTRFLKASHLITKIFTSGVIDYIEEKLLPSAIVVFGSARKGEYTKDSDIDLFVETTKKETVDLSEFEKRLKHKIQLFTEPDISNVPKELFNNVINGIKVSGYLRIK